MRSVVRHGLRALPVLALCLLVSACTPTMFQQPVSNFNKATGAAKEVYFAQLERTHQSFVFKTEMNLELGMITRSNFNYQGEYYRGQKKELARLKTANPILDTSLKVRQGAFEALAYYGQVLQALASDEKLEGLKGEVTGFAKDLQSLSKTIANLKQVSGSLQFLGKVSQWAGPLSAAAELLNQVVDIAGKYLRDKAIREAIITSNDSVQELLEVLRKEAVKAAARERTNYQMALEGCEGVLQGTDGKPAATRYLAHRVCLGAELKLAQAPSPEEVGQVLLLVAKTHAELKVMAQKGAVETAQDQIRRFYEQVLVLKGKLAFYNAQ